MRIFVTGSADGLGKATATTLLAGGHEVVVHVRNRGRLDAVGGLVDAGATVVIGDLGELDDTLDVADQVNALGRMDAVIHNAGVYSGGPVMPVNVVAPYVLTATMLRPDRLVYLSSGMHRSGRPNLDHTDWSGHHHGDYSASKLFVTTIASAVAMLWPTIVSNAVDPGWVPTKMGGPSAPDDLRLGHLTQEWLATSNDPRALTTGGYWHHQKLEKAHAAAHDEAFQERLLASLEEHTGVALPPASALR